MELITEAFLYESNRESGQGRFNVTARRIARRELAFALEVKITEDFVDIMYDAGQGAKQIEDKDCVSNLKRAGYRKIMTYGISFYRKTCRVVQGKTYVFS